MLEKLAEPKRLDPRIKRTRELLVKALMELMQEKSFQAITVQDIAERATINRVTFYAHFEDKFALLEYMMAVAFQERVRSRIPAESELTPGNLALLIQMIAELLMEMTARCPPPHGHFEPLMEKQLKAGLYDVLHAWLVQKPAADFRPRPSLEQIATISSWAIYGAAVEWSHGQPGEQSERPATAAEFARQVLPLILANLQPARQA
jgi:AcrR family transcriptional regulator